MRERESERERERERETEREREGESEREREGLARSGTSRSTKRVAHMDRKFRGPVSVSAPAFPRIRRPPLQ